ncbi:MAG: ABC transporter permease [Meiothermus sp.]|nr:ABC transporter permease [Meiothermus sp.]
MLQYTVRRLLLFFPVMLGVLLVVFLTLRLVPGDPAVVYLGLEGSAEEIAEARVRLGLDQPVPVQFARYVSNVLQGEFGRSIFQGSRVTEVLGQALTPTLELAALALVITVVVALPLGILAAARANTPLDLIVTVGALLGVSMPLFWFAILAIQLFSLQLGWLPSFGRGEGLFPSLASGSIVQLGESLRYAFLPALTLALGPIAIVTRLTRGSMLEVLALDYVRTARSKGLSERAVIYRHALRNAFLPILTVLGLQFGTLLGGAVITESIYAWPGLGRLVVGAINQRDYPVVQGTVIVVALLVSLVNLLIDLSYAFVNPRIRYG